MRKVFPLFFGIYLLIAGLVPAQAQTSSRVSLYALQTTSFPTMTAGLDVFDSTGDFVTGLTPDSITLLEDNQPRPIKSLEELLPGVKFTLALDPGPFFAYRDVNAVTRFDKVVQAVKTWTAIHPDSLGDDLSLVPTDGSPTPHLVTTAAFSDALAAYQPDLQRITSNPETLSHSLDIVTETTSQAGMKPVVLYITSVPTAAAISALDNLTQRAVDENIRVNVWIVASRDYFSHSGATALKDLAIRTGGQYVLFSGQEPLPSLETYLTPLRHSYHLTYSSGVLTSGSHSLTAQVNLSGEKITSAALPFDLNIQPPNPILVSPPVQIVRAAPDERTTAISSFLPSVQPISIIIEFPDGRKRPLASTTLYVDGKKVAENTTEPFTQFIWDISGYSVSGQHTLTVEAVDSFGLSKISLGLPVIVTIIQPQVGLLPYLSRNSRWVALVAILVAGLGLGLTLTLNWKRKFNPDVAGRGFHRDPLTQKIQSDGQRHGLHLPWARPAKPAEAYLVRLKDDGQPITSPPVPVITPGMTFGSDPIQATRILDDPSVSPLHARLTVKNGEYILTDEKSGAGTWVNYEPLTTPRHLQHGDVLQIGRFSYRFMLRKPPERPAPKITPTQK
jgi:hypothetical protein